MCDRRVSERVCWLVILDEIERVCVREGERVRERRVGVLVKVGGDVCICSKQRECVFL